MGLVQALNEAGVSVQLKHDDKETTWEDHGYVHVMDNKVQICANEKFQHNWNYDKRDEWSKEFVGKVEKHFAAQKSSKSSDNAEELRLEENVEDMTLEDDEKKVVEKKDATSEAAEKTTAEAEKKAATAAATTAES